MSLIKNLVKEPEQKESNSKKSTKDNDGDKSRPIIKSALDLQRLKLEKLMKNPEKPVVIPEHRREKDYMQQVPTFVRNVMGSSAGAGSGEFHVYRHLRRKEYARQKMIQHKSVQEQLDDDYQQKLEDNLRISEEKTAKKRAKRQKKKHRAKKPRQPKKPSEESAKDNDDDDSSSDSNEGDADIAPTDNNCVPTCDNSTKNVPNDDTTTNVPSETVSIDKTTENIDSSPEKETKTENCEHEAQKILTQ